MHEQKKAAKLIRKKALNSVQVEDQKQFIESVETSVISLHEGNIAWYRLESTSV
jgi:hypothetical protein